MHDRSLTPLANSSIRRVRVDYSLLSRPDGGEYFYAPVGRLSWRGRRQMRDVEEEARSLGKGWPLLKAGLFGGSLDRFLETKKRVDAQISNTPSW